ncbi:MAG TPA: hypothetical protein V6C95_16550 [Coleofasciculaceae cyanobacterium]
MKFRGRYVALPGHEADVAWLQQKLKQLDGELKQVEQGQAVETLMTFGEIAPLFTPEGALVGNSIQLVDGYYAP